MYPGNPAVSLRSVAFRPYFTAGLALAGIDNVTQSIRFLALFVKFGKYSVEQIICKLNEISFTW